MSGISIFEYDTLVASDAVPIGDSSVHAVPANVFSWLERRCLQNSGQGGTAWLRMTQRRGRRAVQVTSFVGVIPTTHGFNIEVLPKTGKRTDVGSSRQLLVDMLCCLQAFRHVKAESARLSAARIPLFEVFIGEFLTAVKCVVKKGIRSDYEIRQGNLLALRGRLLVETHLRDNLYRPDRFFTEHEEFSNNRPENRILHAALRRSLLLSSLHHNQQLARELSFVFDGIPISMQLDRDFQRVRLDRGMEYYSAALDWARLLLEDETPLARAGAHNTPSLLFPMEALFEAFVTKHLIKQLMKPHTMHAQSSGRYLVKHQGKSWFRLKPDLLVREGRRHIAVMDTKWKLLDAEKSTRGDKYGLSQGDFYQLYAYGQSYLDGNGDVYLIYPKTDAFDRPLPVFDFPKASELRLWVVPFCLLSGQLHLPEEQSSFSLRK